MPLRDMADTFWELEDDLASEDNSSPRDKAYLEFQTTGIARWKNVALIADAGTPNNIVYKELYDAAYNYHVKGNMFKYHPYEDTEPDFEQEAFAAALVSIELAPYDAQFKALTKLLPLVEKLIENPDIYTDYYTSMLNKLGPRLDIMNQRLVLAWVINHVLTQNDEGIIHFADEVDFDPNAYVTDYSDEIKSEVAKLLVEKMADGDTNFIYYFPVEGWLATLLPKDDPRYVQSFEIPLEGKNFYLEAWALPTGDSKDAIILADKEYPERSCEIPVLLRQFNQAASDPKCSDTERSAIITTVQKMAITFTQQAQVKGNQPLVQRALHNAVADLYAFKIDK